MKWPLVRRSRLDAEIAKRRRGGQEVAIVIGRDRQRIAQLRFSLRGRDGEIILLRRAVATLTEALDGFRHVVKAMTSFQGDRESGSVYRIAITFKAEEYESLPPVARMAVVESLAREIAQKLDGERQSVGRVLDAYERSSV